MAPVYGIFDKKQLVSAVFIDRAVAADHKDDLESLPAPRYEALVVRELCDTHQAHDAALCRDGVWQEETVLLARLRDGLVKDNA